MKVDILTHYGQIDSQYLSNYSDEVDYVIVNDKKVQEFAILNNFVPTICILDDAYIRLYRDNNEVFISIIDAILEFNNNVLTILCREAHAGKTLEEALAFKEEVKKERLDQNRKSSVDAAINERKLKENIRKTGAGKL